MGYCLDGSVLMACFFTNTGFFILHGCKALCPVWCLIFILSGIAKFSQFSNVCARFVFKTMGQCLKALSKLSPDSSKCSNFEQCRYNLETGSPHQGSSQGSTMMMGESDKLKATVATLESELKAKESHITVLEAELRSMNRKLQSRDADITRQVSGYLFTVRSCTYKNHRHFISFKILKMLIFLAHL